MAWAERVSYPGYRWFVTSTAGRKPTPPGPFIYGNYSPPDDKGMSIRTVGYADSMTDAVGKARLGE